MDGDLSFLDQIQKKSNWTPELAKRFLGEMEKGIKAGLGIAESLERAAKTLSLKIGTSKGFWDELRAARREGHNNIDAYFKAGRPCRWGKKKVSA